MFGFRCYSATSKTCCTRAGSERWVCRIPAGGRKTGRRSLTFRFDDERGRCNAFRECQVYRYRRRPRLWLQFFQLGAQLVLKGKFQEEPRHCSCRAASALRGRRCRLTVPSETSPNPSGSTCLRCKTGSLLRSTRPARFSATRKTTRTRCLARGALSSSGSVGVGKRHNGDHFDPHSGTSQTDTAGCTGGRSVGVDPIVPDRVHSLKIRHV